MKKVIVILAVLALAMPSMAAITLSESGKSGTTVTVNYTWNGSGSAPRAFALILQATGGTITSVTPYMKGQSGVVTTDNPSGLKGYGIFPGSITIDSAGTVTTYGTPVEPTALPGGPSELGTARVVVALGSLYVADGNKPYASGVAGQLFTVVCSAGTTQLSVTPEVTSRGGVVNELAATETVTPDPLLISFATAPPVPTGLAASDGTSATQKTLTWNASTGATSYTIKYNNKNDLTSAVQLVAGVATTTYAHVTNHGDTTWYWVAAVGPGGTSAFSTPDSGYLTECYPNTVPARKTRWITYGRPDCWCYARNCKGDADGLSQGKSPNGPYWVSTNDLNILKSGWQKLDAAMVANNICADFDRTSQGKSPNGPYAVSTNDLNTLKSQWQIVNGPASGLCENTKAVATASGPMP